MTAKILEKCVALFWIVGVLLYMVGCTPMPLKEGPNARLLPGCEKPRDRNNMDLTVHRPWVVGHLHCMHEAIVTDQPGEAALMGVAGLAGNIVIGCANVPTDQEIEEAGASRPWATVIAPAWSDYWLEHEMRHAECWDHPAYHTDETWEERDMP